MFTISPGAQDSYDEHPHHDWSSESQQQQEQHADHHSYKQTTERGGRTSYEEKNEWIKQKWTKHKGRDQS